MNKITDKSFKDMLVTLSKPAKIFFSYNELLGNIKIEDKITTGYQWPPWPTAPDILYNTEMRVFVGLSYMIGNNYRSFIKRLSVQYDSDVFRYNDLSQKEWREPYKKDDDNHYLEIIWTPILADKYEVAQLDGIGWYYTKGKPSLPLQGEEINHLRWSNNITPEEAKIVAVGVIDVGELLNSFNLVMPARYFGKTYILP